MKKNTVLKLIGLSVLAMITLVIISIMEVAIYSYVINPGQEVSVYEAHAVISAPYVSGGFGFIVFFLVARYWKRKDYQNLFTLVILFPIIYIMLDILVLLLIGGFEWSEFILIFTLANGSKFLGSYLGYKLTI